MARSTLRWLRAEKKGHSCQYRSLPLWAHTFIANETVHDEHLSWLYEQLAELEPVECSICLLLFEGFRYREIAEMLGIPEQHLCLDRAMIMLILGSCWNSNTTTHPSNIGDTGVKHLWTILPSPAKLRRWDVERILQAAYKTQEHSHSLV